MFGSKHHLKTKIQADTELSLATYGTFAYSIGHTSQLCIAVLDDTATSWNGEWSRRGKITVTVSAAFASQPTAVHITVITRTHKVTVWAHLAACHTAVKLSAKLPCMVYARSCCIACMCLLLIAAGVLRDL